jgi:hypothetical protein
VKVDSARRAKQWDLFFLPVTRIQQSGLWADSTSYRTGFVLFVSWLAVTEEAYTLLLDETLTWDYKWIVRLEE